MVNRSIASFEAPEFLLDSFETGMEGFVKSENLADLYVTNTAPSAPAPVSGSYMLELASQYVSGQSWRTVSKTLAKPLDITKIPFFLGYFSSYGVSDSPIELKLSFYDNSGHSFTETLTISANAWNKMKINLSSWQYKSALKRIEISFRAANYADAWDSKHQIDSIGFTSQYGWDFTANNDLGGWTLQNDLTGEIRDGSLVTSITGNDPFISNHHVYLGSDSVQYIKLRIKNETAATMGAVYWATNLSGWDGTKKVTFPIQANDSEFREYIVDVSASPAWSNTIQDIRIDIPEASSLTSGTVRYESITLSARTHAVHGMIDKVEATADAIIVEGSITCAAQKTVKLFALQPYEELDFSGRTPLATATHGGGTMPFTFRVSRYNGASDRIYSKYAVTVDDIPVSLPQYVTVYPAAVNQYAYPVAPSIKGLQVQMADDSNLLGINHAALNCSLSELLYKNAVVAPDNIIPFTLEGETYYFNKGAVESLDSEIKSLSDDHVNVTLILFYMGSLVSADYPYEITRHPDYIDGAGAAINTTNASGVQYWKAICEFLASRYTRTDAQYGRVLNYIVGNEICSAGVWNDMGHKQINEFVEDYARTFRIAYTAMMKYHAQVRMHISLDHHWTAAYAPEEPTRSYRGKEIVDFFHSQIALQGNIHWCLAHHPYASNMQNPYIWNDPAATDSIQTEKITFKNLHILPQYLSQSFFLDNGQLRVINLTEQGFTSLEPYNVESQKVQAAAYCYAYYKARFTSGIQSFIYHRHVDFTGETIWVGLWNNVQNGSVPNEPYQKKYIYDVFKKIDTKDSQAVSAFALPIIGVSSWSEVIPNFDPNTLNQMPTPQEVSLSVRTASAPTTHVSDFEASTDGWYAGENSLHVQRVATFSNAPTLPYHGSFCLQNSFKLKAPVGGARANVGVTKVFDTPFNATATPVFQFAVNSYGGAPGATQYHVKVIVYSGYQKLIGSGNYTPDSWNVLSMDLSTWEFKESIEKIKIWVSTDSTAKWIASYQIDYAGFSAT